MHAGGQYVIDPSRLVREMSPRTLGLYRAMWVIDPQDMNRLDRAAGQIANAVVHAAGANKQDGTEFRPADFTPYIDAQHEPEELARMELERSEAELSAFFDRASGHKAHCYLEQ